MATGGIVYGLLSPSGKIYIGQTMESLNVRLYKHRHEAEHGSETAIAKAIRKYGLAQFKTFKLIDNADKHWRDFYESTFINLFHSHVRMGGYNISVGGDGTLGFRHSEEQKCAISKRQKGKKVSAETRTRMAESRKRWYAAGNQKPPMSAEHLQKCVAAMARSQQRLKGIPNTPKRAEAQRKATIAAMHITIGSKWTEERRSKITETWRRKLGK